MSDVKSDSKIHINEHGELIIPENAPCLPPGGLIRMLKEHRAKKIATPTPDEKGGS